MNLTSRTARSALVTIVIGGFLLISASQAIGEGSENPETRATTVATAVATTSTDPVEMTTGATGEPMLVSEDSTVTTENIPGLTYPVALNAYASDGATVTSDMLRDGTILQVESTAKLVTTEGVLTPTVDGATATVALNEQGFQNFNVLGWALMIALLVLTLVGIGVSIRDDKSRRVAASDDGSIDD